MNDDSVATVALTESGETRDPAMDAAVASLRAAVDRAERTHARVDIAAAHTAAAKVRRMLVTPTANAKGRRKAKSGGRYTPPSPKRA